MIKAQPAPPAWKWIAFKAQSQNMVDNSTAALNIAKANDISNDQVRQAFLCSMST